jgi:hypothetical protein
MVTDQAALPRDFTIIPTAYPAVKRASHGGTGNEVMAERFQQGG